MLSLLERVTISIDRVLLTIGCLFLAAMIVHITADVLLRALFSASIIGTLETVSYYHMVIAVFLPLAYVERNNENIRVDLFVQMMPGGIQLALYVFACVIGLVFFGALAYQSFLDAYQSTVRKETIMSNFLFYIWPSRWALPLGFAGVCLAIINNLFKALAHREAL